MIRTMGAGLAALALAGIAAPAEAGDRKPRRHRHEDKVDAGDVALGALLIGGVLALAAGKKRAPAPEPVAYQQADAAQAIPTALDADSAADACAEAAEAQGTRLARVVRVDRISAVDAVGEGWAARGMLMLRDSYRESGDARMRGFRCSIGASDMPSVRFDGEEVADLQPAR